MNQHELNNEENLCLCALWFLVDVSPSIQQHPQQLARLGDHSPLQRRVLSRALRVQFVCLSCYCVRAYLECGISLRFEQNASTFQLLGPQFDLLHKQQELGNQRVKGISVVR